MSKPTGVLIVYVEDACDEHLKRVAKFAKQAAATLRGSGVPVEEFRHGAQPAEDLARRLSEGGYRLVVFYTHGCERNPGCGVGYAASEPNPCACVVGYDDAIILDTSRCQLLKGVTVYGATACHLGGAFSDHAVTAGADGTLGYAGEYSHAVWSGMGAGPFEEIANAGTRFLAAGLSAAETRERLRTLYQQYIDAQEPPAGVPPGDWCMMVPWLRENQQCLRSRQ